MTTKTNNANTIMGSIKVDFTNASSEFTFEELAEKFNELNVQEVTVRNNEGQEITLFAESFGIEMVEEDADDNVIKQI